ncbi:DNA polymerase IV, partial [Candidatus Parvarchaeota archaeon]|nr:DNA polymerase IV [Candidatus Parvarchaeota archaeon]
MPRTSKHSEKNKNNKIVQENEIMPHITHRIVLHLDMDSFFASCEQRQNPALFGKPVAVCIFSGRDSDSGAISTANYAARALGIKSGMPIKMAKKIAPQATYLPANFALYTGVSDSILEIVKVHCKTTQQASIDEVYADITFEASGDYRIAKALAQTIKKEVFEQEKLTCSIGIAPNKLVAKIASDFQKPDGLTVVKPDEVPGFLSPLPVKKLLGVGPKTESELAKLGIESIADLRKREMSELVGLLGVARGKWLYESSRGTDAQPVQQR